MKQEFLNRLNGSRLQAIQDRASKQFRNAIGDEFSNATGMVSQIDPNDRTITFIVTLIATTTTGKARLFGWSEDGQADATNTSNNVTVTVDESSHGEIKSKSAVSPFRVKGVKMATSTSATQFNNKFTLTFKSPNGASVSKIWNPGVYREPENNQSLLIKDPNFQLPINAFTKIEFNVNTGETVTIYMFISEEVDSTKVLNNKSVLSVSNSRMPEGKSPMVIESSDVKAYYGRGMY